MIKTIFWDFDGVLMNSNAVRDEGFIKVLADFSNDEVEKLLAFHRENGGLSRYVKFRYFFEKIRNEEVTNEQINDYARRFSVIMKELLVNVALLIEDTIKFVRENHTLFTMHIVSGSDQSELRYLCEQLEIARYFKSIHGSPTPKNNLVANLLTEYNYDRETCVLIGDSINDYEAAVANGVFFCAYNNASLDVLTNYKVSIS